jgi:polysaccharide biosynthesis/export protein
MKPLAALAVIGIAFCLLSQGQEQTARVTVDDAPPGYVLGAGDQFVLEIPDLEELNGKVHRIDSDGTVSLPLVGRVQAAGYTLPDFEKELDNKLLNQLKEPHITVTVTEILSQPVTVLGEVNSPGTHQIRGPQPLTEVLSLAGGLKNDAGYRITITRREKYGQLPLKNVRDDAVSRTTTAEVSVSDILEARNPEENIQIMPYDVITVPRAKLVYVMGEVRKPGGFTLEQHDTVSVLQAVAMAEGLTPAASKKKTIIMREEPGSDKRTEIHLNLANVMNGKDPQVDLQANDILYVPNSAAYTFKMRAIETAIATGSGILIWRAAF